MSAAVINPCGALNEFVTELTGNGCSKRYGEVFISQWHTVILRCCLCEEEHLVYQQFVEHIFEHYYSGIGAVSTQLRSESAREVEVKIDLEEIELNTAEDSEASTAEVPSFELAGEVLPEVDISQPTENGTYDNPWCEVRKLTEDVSCDIDEVLLEETVHEICSTQSSEIDELMSNLQDDSVKKTSESSRGPSPLPKPKKEYTCKKPVAKNQLGEHDEHTYKCETCGLVLKTNRGLREHNRRHTGETRYECDICKKGFYKHVEMVIHKRRHTGERPFVCKFCGESFISSSRRGQHEKQHERRIANARLFKCEFCEKGFNEARHLKAHIVVHTGERKHGCSVCNAAFLHRKHLVAHLKIHTNAREYTCKICGNAFNQPASRLLHMRNKHKVATNSTSTKKTEL